MQQATIQVMFDESGNTGENLADSAQPVFALSSTCITESDARRIVAPMINKGATEFKYSKIKGNYRNYDKIKQALMDDSINEETCKIYLINKQFMTISKLVDNIYEPSAREEGLDLYERKAALATANMLSVTLPAFLGQQRASRILDLFNSIVRKDDGAKFNQFHAEIEKSFDHLQRKHRDASSIIAPVVAACRRGYGYIKENTAPNDHHPWTPAIYALIQEWTNFLDVKFDLIHDDLKIISSEQDRILKQSDARIKPKTLIHFGKSIKTPYAVNSISTSNSACTPSIQVCDLLAGAAAHCLSSRALRVKPEEIENEILSIMFKKKLLVGGLWPSGDMSAEELEATVPFGDSPLEYTMKILKDDPEVYNTVGT